MGTPAAHQPVAELAARLRSLPVADQLEVLREALRPASPAPDETFRTAVERVLQEDRDILESLSD